MMTPLMLNGSDDEWYIYADWLEERGRAEEAMSIREEIHSPLDLWTYEWRGIIGSVGGGGSISGGSVGGNVGGDVGGGGGISGGGVGGSIGADVGGGGGGGGGGGVGVGGGGVK